MLISIRPQWTGDIFSEIKRIEWRKRDSPAGLYLVYETNNGGGCGRIIGTFEVHKVLCFGDPEYLTDQMIEEGCVPREELRKYYRGQRAYALYITNARLLPKRHKIDEIRYPNGKPAKVPLSMDVVKIPGFLKN